ncbi:hypothetical protein [Veillonella parvula]
MISFGILIATIIIAAK